MDGLECSENFYSTAFAEERFDSEYYLKSDLINEKRIVSLFCKRIGDFAFVTDGIHTSIDFDNNSNINLISAKAPKNNYFDLSGTGYISSVQNQENFRTQLKINDVIISTVGTIGNCAVVNETVLPANADRHVGIIRVNDNSEFKPRYISTFILSKFGQFQVKRFTTGNVQPNLFIYKIKDIKIPVVSFSWQNIIDKLVLKSEKLRETSDSLMLEAEHDLLKFLDADEIVKQDFIKHNVAIKNLSNSFELSGRLDSEYYQTKYDTYVSALHTTDTVNSLCNIHDKNYEPKGEELYKYIELANVGKTGDISNVELSKGSELPSRARRKVTAGQVIVSSVEGSLQSCALITDEFDGALCSTGFYVLTSESINSETLLVLFKSEVMQALMKQRCSGTILTAITKDELLSMPLPKIDESVQFEIAAKLKESFALRRKSKELLEAAKRAVEIAIEEGEESATTWLKQQLSEED